MEDTLHRVLYNGATAAGAGSLVDHSDYKGTLIAGIVGILAPVLRDILVKGLTKLFNRKK